MYDCIVIGGGPGGLVAALYLQRFKRKVALVDRGDPRALRIPRIHNLIACPEGMSGKNMVALLHQQLRDLKTEVIRGSATVAKSNKTFRVRVGGRVLRARKIILATGVKDVEPDIDNYNELCLDNVTAYCPICDGYEYSNEPIGILAKDTRGLKKIKFIASYSRDVRVFLIKDIAIPPKLKKEIRRLNVKVYQGKLQSLKCRKQPRGLIVKLEGHSPVRVRVAYVSLGIVVNSEAFAETTRIRRTQEGHIVVSAHQETSVSGIYAVGDCVNDLSQVSVATGHAAIAATRIHNELLGCT